LIELEGDGCSDADGREDGMGASAVAGCDTSPILGFDEEVLDLVTLSAEPLS
jgi:hypothetical protein